MGIRDRDYMKRRPAEAGDGNSSADSKLESWLHEFFQRHPRFFIYVGIGSAVLVVIALIISIISGKSH